MISADLFPFRVDGDVLLGDVVVDAAFDADYPSPTVFGDVDGYSHMPLSFAENTAFISDGAAGGLMEFQVRLTDVRGDGWFIRYPFEIVAD